jgi:hypothetical protein
MVVSFFLVIINCSYINHNVTSVQDSRISGPIKLQVNERIAYLFSQVNHKIKDIQFQVTIQH